MGFRCIGEWQGIKAVPLISTGTPVFTNKEVRRFIGVVFGARDSAKYEFISLYILYRSHLRKNVYNYALNETFI